MDQDAFRQLISTSSAVSGSSSNRAFGKAPKRSTTTSTSTKPSDLKPRKLKPHTKNNSDGYVDRASARRSGAPSSEFSDIEALHRDFEARIAAAETDEERQRLREQISSVGGDAKHSVLVKGLDWALLAQNRARIECESGGAVSGEREEDLESAFQEGRAEKDAGGKRSRDDIVDAIRRRREAKVAAGASIGASGFRPIGFKPIGGAEKASEDDGAEYKWVNGKRMRKKKKGGLVAGEQSTSKDSHDSRDAAAEKSGSESQKAEGTTPSLDATDPMATLQSSTVADSAPGQTEKEASISETAPEAVVSSKEDLPATPKAPQTPHAPQEEEDDDDDEDDIFADVGGWDGIPDAKDEDDRDSEEGAISPPSVVPPAASSQTPPPIAAAAPPSASPPATVPQSLTGTLPAAAIETLAASPKEDRQPPCDAAPELKPAVEPHFSSVSTTISAAESSPQPPSPAAPEPKPKSKKSKWDDDLDDAKKKKKKHH